MSDYLRRLTDIGFGTIEVRARRPYRVLSPRHYSTPHTLIVESVEICAIKDPMPADGIRAIWIPDKTAGPQREPRNKSRYPR